MFYYYRFVLDDHQYNISMERWSNLQMTANISKSLKSQFLDRVIAVPGGGAIINTMESMDRKMNLLMKDYHLHMQSLNTTGLSITAYITTEKYLYTVEQNGLITKFELASRFAKIQTFELERPVNVISACLFSENELLIGLYEGYCMGICMTKLIIYDMSIRKSKPVLPNELHPYLLSCMWNNSCTAVTTKSDTECHGEPETPLCIYQYNRETWKKRIVKLRPRDRRSLEWGFGWLDMTDYGTFLIPDPEEYKLTEYSSNGEFLRNLITKSDGFGRPMYVSYDHPYLWVVFRKGDPSEGNSFNDILLKFTVKPKDN